MPSDLAAATFADLDIELAITRRILDRLPADRLDWRPHPSSMPLGDLAVHIANLLRWPELTLSTDAIDMAQIRPPADPPETRAGILALWDRNAEALRALASSVSDDDLAASWSLQVAGATVSTDPRHLVIRRWSFSHIVHHRGQLSVYLRLLGIAVPPLYGPTADERGF